MQTLAEQTIRFLCAGESTADTAEIRKIIGGADAAIADPIGIRTAKSVYVISQGQIAASIGGCSALSDGEITRALASMRITRPATWCDVRTDNGA